MTFELKEHYDLDAIKHALASPALENDTARDLINLHRLAKESPSHEITVAYKKKGSHGRCYPTHGHHQACYQWKHLRASLSQGETDIDAVNCAPTIFTAICKQLGMHVDFLQQYLDNRQRFIDDLNLTQTEIENHNRHTNGCSTKYDIGKSVFNAFMNGANRNTYWKNTKKGMNLGKDVIVTKSKSHELIKEIERGKGIILGNARYKDYVDMYKRGALFHVITEIEFQLVRALMKEFATNGVSVTKYIFDGFHVKCTDEGKIDGILNGYTNDYGVQFVRKPFPNTLDKLTLVMRSDEQIEADLKRLEAKVGFTDEQVAKACCERTDVKLVDGMLVKYSDKYKRYIEIEWQSLMVDMHVTRVFPDGKEDEDYLKNAKGMRDVEKALKLIWKEQLVNMPNFITDLNKRTKHKVFFKCGHWWDMRSNKTGNIDENCAAFWCIDRRMPDFEEYHKEHPDVISVDTKIMNIFRDDMKPHAYHALARALGGNALDDKLTYLVPGDRDSGKSALMKACETHLGQFPLGPVTSMDVLQVAPNASTDAKALSTLLTQNIDKARIAFGSELRNQQYPINGNVYKQLQGGDLITARTNHRDEKTIKNNCTYFLCFNPPKGKTLPDISPPDTIQACKVWFMPYVFTETPKREFERLRDKTLWDKMVDNKQNWGDAFLWLLYQNYQRPTAPEPEDWTEPTREHAKATTQTTIDVFYDLYEFEEGEYAIASRLREDLNLDVYNLHPWLKRKFKSKAEACNGFRTMSKKVDGKNAKVYVGFKRKVNTDAGLNAIGLLV